MCDGGVFIRASAGVKEASSAWRVGCGETTRVMMFKIQICSEFHSFLKQAVILS